MMFNNKTTPNAINGITINNTFLDYGIDFHDIVCARQNEKTEVIEI